MLGDLLLDGEKEDKKNDDGKETRRIVTNARRKFELLDVAGWQW